MISLLTLATAALATDCAPEGAGVSPFALDLAALDPDLSIVIVPSSDPSHIRGLPTHPIRWGTDLSYLGAAHQLPTSRPPTDEVFVERLDPRDLAGIQGVPVMLEGGHDGVFPGRNLVSANPTPYPYPVPVLDVSAERSGWTVARDGSALVGVGPLPWLADGVEVEGVAVLLDGDRVVGALGLPVLEDDRGTRTTTCEIHLVLGSIDPDSM